MSMHDQGIDMGFTKERPPKGSHVCLIYDREEDRRTVVAEFLAAGLRQGEQVRYLADTTPADDIRSWLGEIGVNIPDEAVPNPAFSLMTAEKAYCPEGHFDPPAYVQSMPRRFALSKSAGFRGMRTCGEMTWALKGIAGSERLLEYEAMLNLVETDFCFSGMCQYDARLFDGATLFKVLKVHPWMVVKGKIVQNPYFVPPEEFLLA
jgi:hypothetical protein